MINNFNEIRHFTKENRGLSLSKQRFDKHDKACCLSIIIIIISLGNDNDKQGVMII